MSKKQRVAFIIPKTIFKCKNKIFSSKFASKTPRTEKIKTQHTIETK